MKAFGFENPSRLLGSKKWFWSRTSSMRKSTKVSFPPAKCEYFPRNKEHDQGALPRAKASVSRGQGCSRVISSCMWECIIWFSIRAAWIFSSSVPPHMLWVRWHYSESVSFLWSTGWGSLEKSRSGLNFTSSLWLLPRSAAPTRTPFLCVGCLQELQEHVDVMCQPANIPIIQNHKLGQHVDVACVPSKTLKDVERDFFLFIPEGPSGSKLRTKQHKVSQ